MNNDKNNYLFGIFFSITVWRFSTPASTLSILIIYLAFGFFFSDIPDRFIIEVLWTWDGEEVFSSREVSCVTTWLGVLWYTYKRMSTQRPMDCNEHDDGVVSIAVSKIHELNDISVVLGFIRKEEQIPDDKPGEQGRTSNCEARFSLSYGLYLAKWGTFWYLLSSTNEDTKRN